MTRNCKICGQGVIGQDAGKKPSYLFFDCPCGNFFYEECTGDFIDQTRDTLKYGGLA